jgi:WXXGXW repeat (2 copies)
MRILRAVLVPFVVVAALALGGSTASLAQVGMSVAIAPPPLPVYAQPPIPGPGYMWTPGYWAYGPAGYYWVPGAWVLPPAVGLLWTPGYWSWGAGGFLFHAGYWGPQVGFYGGINYGFGYFGTGFAGGYWSHGTLYYNHAVTNFGNTRIVNVYNRNVTVNRVTRVSYNGGAGGTTARPTPAELAAAREHRLGPTAAQLRQEHAAGADPALRASVNHGKLPIAATARAGELRGRGVVAARGTAGVRPAAAEHRPEAAHERATRERAAHALATRERATHERAMRERTAHALATGERAPRERVVQRRAEPHPVQHRAAQRQAAHGRERGGHA